MHSQENCPFEAAAQKGCANAGSDTYFLSWEGLLTASRSRKQTAKLAPNNTDAICWAMPQIRRFCLKKTIADFNPMVLANGEFGI